jgi:recombination protein RecA
MKKEEKIEDVPTIAEALKELRKQYGQGVILQADNIPRVEAIPTNCFAIDRLLGCGGLPKGRLIEIYGEPGEGKTTLCLFFAAQIQKGGGSVVYIDAENAFNADYAEDIGVDMKKIMISQPDTMEETFATIKALIATNKIDLIVVDSVAALIPQAETEGDNMFKETMALQARSLGKYLRILSGPIAKSKTIVIFINQTRSKVGNVWGNPETTPGGVALKFFSSIRLKVSKGDKIMNGDAQIGNTVKIQAIKNKVGMPFKKCSFDLFYSTGVDMVSDTFNNAEELKVVSKDGLTYSFGEKKLGIGRDKAVIALKEDPDLYKKVRDATTAAVKNEV